jgi:hypothetical protein
VGLWLTDKAISHSKWRVALAIFFTVFALTHVPNLLVCTIFWLIYTLCCLINQSWKSVAMTIVYAMMGLAIASPYLLPALLEKGLVQTDILRGVGGGFKGQFIVMYFSDKWTFSPRYITHIFIYGLLHSVLFISMALFLYKPDNPRIKEIFCWFFFLMILSFLMNQYSTPIWQSNRTLQMIQFPWRLLGLFSFGVSALCGIAVSGLKKSKNPKKTFFLLIIIISLVWNAVCNYSFSLKKPTLSNPGKEISSGAYIQIQRALYDPYTNKLIDAKEYLPLIHNGYSTPSPVIGQPPVSLVSGKASIQINQWASYKRLFNVIVEKTSTIKVRTYYYPAWHLYINKKSHPIRVSNDGTIELSLEPGSYSVELHYLWTFAFTMGIITSLFSSITLILFGIQNLKSRSFLSSKTYLASLK